jgi:hypothetical protein
MTGASIYVTAVISASAAILGASITPLTTIYQNARYARRERQMRHETAVRDECIKLLRAVWDLRTMAANNNEYHGDEMGARLAKVRRRAADASMRWVMIATLAPGDLGSSAKRLGMAADHLAVERAKNTDLDRGRSLRDPEFGEIDSCIKDFGERVVAYFGG